MFNQKRLLALSLALAMGGGFFAAAHLQAAPGTTTVTMCFRNRTITVPSYLRATYITYGATDGDCPPSQ